MGADQETDLREPCGIKVGKPLDESIEHALRGARTARTSLQKSTNLRLSLSVSTILLLHRILYRFFLRLRASLRSKDALPFRRRNPRIARSLTSRIAPAVGASLAGFALAIYPADQLRLSVAIYSATRALEFLYNALEGDGWLKDRPWWWGSWMLTPFATGQLLHAFVFDRDCVSRVRKRCSNRDGPAWLINVTGLYQFHHESQSKLRADTTAELPSSPRVAKHRCHCGRTAGDVKAEVAVGSSSSSSYCSHADTLDSRFISPILFPDKAQTLPPTLTQLSPITSSAHPIHPALSCATLHPSDPSCFRTFANYILSAFPSIAKFLTLFYGVFSIPRYRKWLADPTSEIGKLARKVLKTATFLTGAIGTSWGSICLFQYLLPGTFLPKARWFWGGFMGGLWAFVDRDGGRARVMYSVRTSIDSLWKVGKKRGWWKAVKGGDVAVFVVGLALMNVLYDRRREAVASGMGKGLGYLRG